MSTCISRAGEYSAHETTEGNYICDRCGVLDEDGIFAERDALRAKVERVEEALAVLDEVAYAQIALEKMLTILPTGPNRAQVPPHWQFDASNRARPFHEHIRAALSDPEERI